MNGPREFGRSLGDQAARPGNKLMTPEVERTIADLRKRMAKMEEELQVLTGERGAAGRPQAAVRRSDLSAQASVPIANPSSALTSGPAGGAYGATEQAMLDELKAAMQEGQERLSAILEVLRNYGFVKRPL